MSISHEEALAEARKILDSVNANRHESPLGTSDNATMLRAALLVPGKECSALHNTLLAMSARVAQYNDIGHLKAMLRLIMSVRLVLHEIGRLVGVHPDMDSKFWSFHGEKAIDKFITDKDDRDCLFEDYERDEGIVPSVDEFTPEAFNKSSGGLGDA